MAETNFRQFILDWNIMKHKKPNDEHIGTILYKIKNCPTYSSLYDMEQEFNKIGLTIQITTNNRMVLCKIKNHKPYCQSIIDDYIFIGILNDKDIEISDKMLQCMTNFIMNAASAPSKILNLPRKWQDGTRLYGHVTVVKEDINYVVQHIVD